jgi:peptidoglycan/xylan/chitin deacetylase (PgdA/CDA1 family)
MTVTDLDQQLAELRSAADAYAARHQFIEDLAWPEGVRIAVNFTCDFDAMLLRRLLNEPPMQLAKGEFGGRVGIWRLVELFDAHGVKATIFTPGRICELYPQALRAVVESGHEIADHMWEHRVPKEPALEEDHLAKTVAALERVAGRRPAGTRSGHSAKLLRQYGYIYRSEGSADQRPHYEFDEGGGNGLVNLPMHYAIDDAMYFNFNWLGSDPSAEVRGWAHRRGYRGAVAGRGSLGCLYDGLARAAGGGEHKSLRHGTAPVLGGARSPGIRRDGRTAMVVRANARLRGCDRS